MRDPAAGGPDETPFETAKRRQREASDPMCSALVLANAGSGKTKVLIDRVARLLLRRPDGARGADPGSLLCITYTRAAANEMLQRLFVTLGAWAVMEDHKLSSALAELEGRDTGSYTSDDLRAARALFARALETPGGLRIETIHAFCARVLRRFPLEAGVLPGFTELEEPEAREIWRAARDAAILAAARDCPDVLGRVARDAGYDGAATALDALKGSYWSALAFAEAHDFDQAAIEEAIRIATDAPDETPEELIHRAMEEELPLADLRAALGPLLAGAKTDRETAEAIEATLNAATPVARWQAYRPVFFTQKDLERAQNPFTKDVAKQATLVADLFETKGALGSEVERMRRLAADLAKAKACARTAGLFRIGVPALLAYGAEKARRGALDFDDLIERTRALLQSEGMSSWVLYKLDGGIMHVLLDEAQDTSPAQWDLIRSLTNEFGAGSGRDYSQDPRTIFVVGDEKQSIYSFQGADPSKFLGEARGLLGQLPDLRDATLEMSFRSCPEVLTYVDAVWNGSPPVAPAADGRVPVAMDLIRHTARRSGEAGCVEVWPIEPKDEEPEPDAWARPLDIVRESSPKARLAQQVAGAVHDMMTDGSQVWDGEGGRRPVRPEDVLILVRKRQGGLFEAIITALKMRGVAVAGADRLRLTDHIGVQDCLNLMRFACLPGRDLTLAEILRGPFVGFVDDDRYLYPLAAKRAKGETLWARVQGSDSQAVQRAAAFLEGVVERADLPPFEFLSAVLDRPGADGTTGWEKLNARLGAPVRDPVEALMAEALAFDSASASSLQAFVAGIESEVVEIKRDLAEAGQAVRVMTVHGAKGLQAPVVILPDTTSAPGAGDDTLFETPGGPVWSPRTGDDTKETQLAREIGIAKAIEEHRRLLYVAMTRAQDRLIIAGHWHDKAPGHAGESWYTHCLAGMERVGAVGTEAGVRRLGLPLGAEASASAALTAAAGLPEWALRDPLAGPAPRRLSAPTSLLGPKMATSAPFDTRREARMRRGRLIHALLQYLPELPDARREAAGRAMLAREAALSDDEREEMLRAGLGVIGDPAMREVFAPGGRAEAAIIGTSPKLAKDLVINGRADRLVINAQGIWVIDYKTDQPAPAAIGDVAESYILQMAAYWAVLGQAFPGRPVTAALCWTDGPRLMRLPEDLLSEALKRADSVV